MICLRTELTPERRLEAQRAELAYASTVAQLQATVELLQNYEDKWAWLNRNKTAG